MTAFIYLPVTLSFEMLWWMLLAVRTARYFTATYFLSFEIIVFKIQMPCVNVLYSFKQKDCFDSLSNIVYYCKLLQITTLKYKINKRALRRTKRNSFVKTVNRCFLLVHPLFTETIEIESAMVVLFPVILIKQCWVSLLEIKHRLLEDAC